MITLKLSYITNNGNEWLSETLSVEPDEQMIDDVIRLYVARTEALAEQLVAGWAIEEPDAILTVIGEIQGDARNFWQKHVDTCVSIHEN